MFQGSSDLLTIMPLERRGGPGQDFMIETIRARNFRCYRDLKVEGLKSVNVVVGANGTGKTALLELLFLASGGSPELGLRLQNFRGMGTALEVNSEGVRWLWRDLFHDFDQSKAVEIDLVDPRHGTRSLRVALGEGEEVSLPINEFEGGSSVEVSLPIDFHWRDPILGPFSIRPRIDGGRIVFPPGKSVARAIFYASQFKHNPEEAAKRLSELSKRDDLDTLLEVIDTVFPEVSGASVENNAGSWQVFVKLRDRTERLPIALHSAGASKFVSILLGIASKQNSCVLIDEIENGFYYGRYGDVWKAFYKVATGFGAQLFVTTHSMECLKALLPVLESNGKDFSLLKTIALEDGSAGVAISSGEAMRAAIAEDFEVR